MLPRTRIYYPLTAKGKSEKWRPPVSLEPTLPCGKGRHLGNLGQAWKGAGEEMRRIQFGLLISYLGTGVLVAALFLQMLPFFFLLTVFAYAFGVSSGGLLAMIPVFFFVLVFAACWLTSKRPQRLPAWQPSSKQQTPKRHQPQRRRAVALMKTRAERYQDLRDILGRLWQ